MHLDWLPLALGLAVIIYTFTERKKKMTETLPYVLVKTGRIAGNEKLIGSGDDSEVLADNADALASADRGSTYSVRGPDGKLLYSARVAREEN